MRTPQNRRSSGSGRFPSGPRDGNPRYGIGNADDEPSPYSRGARWSEDSYDDYQPYGIHLSRRGEGSYERERRGWYGEPPASVRGRSTTYDEDFSENRNYWEDDDRTFAADRADDDNDFEDENPSAPGPRRPRW